MERYDAIVLGAGGVGSATMYHLARRGARVLGIDRFQPPHDHGSSHGHTRAIRQAYFEHPDYVPLLLESYRLWHELEAIAGRQLLHMCGVLQVGPPNGVIVPGVVRAAEKHQLAIERLTNAQVEARWQGLRGAEEFVGVYEPAGGFLLVEECVQAHLDAARSAGAELLPNTAVLDWSAADGLVRVHTSERDNAADRLIVTAGAWAAQLLGELGVRLRVLRKSLFWFATENDEDDSASRLPVYLFDLPHGIFYGFPRLDDRGIKFAEHSGGNLIDDPLTVDRAVDEAEERRCVEVLLRHLPIATPVVTDHVVCMYTMSPDEQFIVDRHPRHANVVFAAGLSGHGFKFTPVLGRALAEMVLDGGTELPIGFLSLARFNLK